jgi:hypothetical protein
LPLFGTEVSKAVRHRCVFVIVFCEEFGVVTMQARTITTGSQGHIPDDLSAARQAKQFESEYLAEAVL